MGVQALIDFEEVIALEPQKYIGDDFSRVTQVYRVAQYNVACCYSTIDQVCTAHPAHSSTSASHRQALHSFAQGEVSAVQGGFVRYNVTCACFPGDQILTAYLLTLTVVWYDGWLCTVECRSVST